MKSDELPSTTFPTSVGICAAWTVLLLVSDLPDAVSQALTGAVPAWLFAGKAVLLLAAMAAGRASKRLGELRPFFFLLLILAAGRKALAGLGLTPAYVAQGGLADWLDRLVRFEGARLFLAACLVAALMLMGKGRREIFLVKGDLSRWKVSGLILGFSIMALTFLFFDYDLPPASFFKALPLLPAAMTFAALAAFDEEVRSRAALLPCLVPVVGKQHAILMTAFYFGMGHYFGGVPSGIAGFVIAGALGWLYAKMMLDTRGIFMPWLNHFFTNVPTFLFWAMGSVSG